MLFVHTIILLKSGSTQKKSQPTKLHLQNHLLSAIDYFYFFASEPVMKSNSPLYLGAKPGLGSDILGNFYTGMIDEVRET